VATLPDYLNDQTEEEIMNRMLKRVPADIDKAEGSFIWDSLAPTAFELFEASLWAQQVLARGFASTTFDEYLDLKVGEYGLTRRPAVKANGSAQFLGTTGTVIPAGTQVATAADAVTATPSILYETKVQVVIDSEGAALASIIAVEPGKQGNVPAGAITIITTPIAGITNVTNVADLLGGADPELDESLLNRFYTKVRNPGTSGNKANYIQWALEIPGVGGVQVESLWNGPGTVRVVLIDTDKRAASQEIVDAVKEYIDPTAGVGEGRAPIGAKATVSAAEEVPINISAKLTLASGATLQEVKDLITSGSTAYLKTLAFVDPLVRHTRVAAILLDIPPIIDFENLTINGGTANIEIQPDQVAVMGTVSVYE